jgi:hypothetical protein
VLKTAALEKADFGDERFDKVFAFNVAPFWLQPKEALGIVRRNLAPNGAVYLFWDARHTEPGRARELADQLSERLRWPSSPWTKCWSRTCARFPRCA